MTFSHNNATFRFGCLACIFGNLGLAEKAGKEWEHNTKNIKYYCINSIESSQDWLLYSIALGAHFLYSFYQFQVKGGERVSQLLWLSQGYSIKW